MNPNEQIYLLKVENGKLKTKNRLSENTIEELKSKLEFKEENNKFLSQSQITLIDFNKKLEKKYSSILFLSLTLFLFLLTSIGCIINLFLKK